MEERQLLLVRMLHKLSWRVYEMAAELDKVEADVAAENTVIDSAVALLAGLKAELDAAIASGDPNRLTALSASIEAKTAALAAAVTANTPAAP
jgi:hypothetical protein